LCASWNWTHPLLSPHFMIGCQLNSRCTSRDIGVKLATFVYFATLQVFGRTLWSRKRIDSRVQRGALRLISKCIRNEHWNLRHTIDTLSTVDCRQCYVNLTFLYRLCIKTPPFETRLSVGSRRHGHRMAHGFLCDCSSFFSIFIVIVIYEVGVARD